ncbi:hypothetical protein HRbin37_02396 [bacterium HR37]|nr:hypothetical protein HRbin37_02396 [bacterium HR37]
MFKTPVAKNNPKAVFGWCMYDWANSAYVTTVAVGLLPIYFASVVVGSEGIVIKNTHYSATAIWGFTVGTASLITFILAPVLGAIADFTNTKKRFLLFFAYTGSIFTILLYFSEKGDIWRTVVFFIIAQVCFISANVFYDAFLPHIVTRDKMDMVSGKGFAYGYIGGGIQFALSFALIALHERLGISQAQAVRIGILTAGLWWAFFTLFLAKNLIEIPPDPYSGPKANPKKYSFLLYTRIGFIRVVKTAKHVRRFKHLVLFLFAYMFYNDGIQTVINMATIYGKDELNLPTTTLLLTLLMVQVVASVGAITFSKISERLGTKKTVMLTLILWSIIVLCAYFVETTKGFIGIGIMIGTVMGGSQALSRSFYGSIIPKEASAEFYGFYNIFTKFSAIWGPFVFATVHQVTGTARNSILSVVVLFLLGFLILCFVDEKKARKSEGLDLFNGHIS